MTEQLQAFLQEEKFVEGACDWPGYTGSIDENERMAFSYNINMCLALLLNAVKNNYDAAYMESIIKYHFDLAKNYLEEQFMCDTDESEVRYMYFEKICKICGTRSLEDILVG
jgi:hypothetical protein